MSIHVRFGVVLIGVAFNVLAAGCGGGTDQRQVLEDWASGFPAKFGDGNEMFMIAMVKADGLESKTGSALYRAIVDKPDEIEVGGLVYSRIEPDESKEAVVGYRNRKGLMVTLGPQKDEDGNFSMVMLQTFNPNGMP